MIYFNFETVNEKNTDAYASLARIKQDIMYRLTAKDIAELQEKYPLEKLSVISVMERCEQYRSALLRIVLLNTVISLFMLLLESFIIVTIIRMEYVVNAKELAIKKVLGYSILSKNKPLFLLNLLAAFIGLGTIVTATLMFHFVEWYYVLLCTGAILILELFFITFHINKIERASIPQILKGGSL